MGTLLIRGSRVDIGFDIGFDFGSGAGSRTGRLAVVDRGVGGLV
jgi:hypothetical protein